MNYFNEPVGIDDQTGFKVPLRKLRKQWDGAYSVNPDKRNPQDLIRVRSEHNALSNPRPEVADTFIADNLIWENGSLMMGENGAALVTEGTKNGAGL